MNASQVLDSTRPRPRWRTRAVAALLSVASVAMVAPAASDAALSGRGWGTGNGLGLDSTATVPRPLEIPGVPADAFAAAVGLQRTLVLTPGGVLTTGIGTNADINGLGEGVAARTLTPLPDTADVKAVSAGDDSSLLLREDGTVWGFGRNQYGSAGGTVNTRVYVPTQVQGLSGIVAIASSGQHSLALDGDGNVWAWGNHLRLGNAAARDGGVATSVPVKVALPHPATQIAAGNDHSLALLNDGTVHGWGVNTDGQLGNNSATTPTDRLPVLVQGLDGLNIKSITAGWRFSFALLQDGTYRGWGRTGSGELGLGLGSIADVLVATARNPSAPAASYPAFDQLVAGRLGAYAISATGRRVYAWGNNTNSGLGGTAENAFPFGSANAITATSDTEIPQRVGNLRDVPWLAVGGTAQHQVLLSEPSLRIYAPTTDFFDLNFPGQQLGTSSPYHEISIEAVGATATVNRIRLEGPNGEDFQFLRGGQTNAIDSIPFPVSILPLTQTLAVRLNFVPTGLGERIAYLVFEGEAETLKVQIAGFGLPLSGGPAGSDGLPGAAGPAGAAGADGKNGRDGKNGKNGVVRFAAKSGAAVRVRRGKVAKLRFSLANRTSARLPRSRATAVASAGLDVRGGRSVAVAALAKGGSRAVTLSLRIGRDAKLGTHPVKVRFTVGGRTVTRTARVRVVR